MKLPTWTAILLTLTGIAAFTIGAGMVTAAAAWIVAGVSLTCLGLLVGLEPPEK